MRPPPGIHLPQAYPDTWKAQEDPGHANRVHLFKLRRNSASSNNSSCPSTPMKSHRSQVNTSSLKSRGGKRRINYVPWQREGPQSPSASSAYESSSQCMSPTESRSGLDRYEAENKLLASQEWMASPSPRGTKRMSPKEYHLQQVRSKKRLSQAEGVIYGHQTSSLRPTDCRQRREVYKPGLIFSTPFHTAMNTGDAYIKIDDPNLTATPFGTVHSKFRKMIVLREFGEHVQCIPIYTHNGNGLQKKENHHEYVSIRDINDESPEPDEGPNPGILACRNINYHKTFIKGKAVVKVTEIYSHRYDAPATIEGRVDVDSDSQQRLFALARRFTL
ncbi:hypothetical protein F5Y04DRAFT_268359 [Hypomontagnella monticulosa]|nr:hypothetical protein F5Y04DRAFT_268359 [Hypomontagnella monticulosa]